MASDPQVGELNDRVKIREWQDVPGFGSSIEKTFDAGVNVWAKIVPTGTAIYIGSMQVDSSITHQMFVRYSPAINERTVTANHVVECDGLRYRVKRANRFKGQKVWLFIETELLGHIPDPGAQP